MAGERSLNWTIWGHGEPVGARGRGDWTIAEKTHPAAKARVALARQPGAVDHKR